MKIQHMCYAVEFDLSYSLALDFAYRWRGQWKGWISRFFALSSHLKLNIRKRNWRYEELAYPTNFFTPCSRVRSSIYMHGLMLTCQHTPFKIFEKWSLCCITCPICAFLTFPPTSFVCYRLDRLKSTNHTEEVG